MKINYWGFFYVMKSKKNDIKTITVALMLIFNVYCTFLKWYLLNNSLNKNSIKFNKKEEEDNFLLIIKYSWYKFHYKYSIL